jgi:hypothetical protein
MCLCLLLYYCTLCVLCITINVYSSEYLVAVFLLLLLEE